MVRLYHLPTAVGVGTPSAVNCLATVGSSHTFADLYQLWMIRPYPRLPGSMDSRVRGNDGVVAGVGCDGRVSNPPLRKRVCGYFQKNRTFWIPAYVGMTGELAVSRPTDGVFKTNWYSFSEVI